MKVVSFGGLVNDGDDYEMWLEPMFGMPTLGLETADRQGGSPVVTAATIKNETRILHVEILPERPMEAWTAAVMSLREALMAALDCREAAKALVVSDEDGGRERYRYFVVQAVDLQPDNPYTHFAATLVSHDEVGWRRTTPTTAVWNVTASGQTTAVTNGGSRPARPRYVFQPTADRTGAGIWDFRMFVAVYWLSGMGYREYPINLTNGLWNTDALITAGDLNGETNIGVVVDGREVRRWVYHYDTENTSVWVNLDFEPWAATNLAAGMGSGDLIDTIQAVDYQSLSGFPFSGILQIDNEIFTYTDKDEATKTFLGVRRATKGSTAANHSANAGVRWIQHEVWIVFGGTGLREISFDDDFRGGYDGYRPLLESISDNSYWSIEEFGGVTDINKNRPLRWIPQRTPRGSTDAVGEPFSRVGVRRVGEFEELNTEDNTATSRWALSVPYLFSEINITGTATKYEAVPWRVELRMNSGAGTSTIIAVPEPSVLNVTEPYSEGVTGVVGGEGELVFEQSSQGAMEAWLENIIIQWLTYPAVMMLPVIDTYTMDLTLTNQTTGQSFDLRLDMALGEQVEVDTERHRVTLLDDDSSQYQALTRSSHRRDILPLAPGVNTLQLTEPGLAGMTVNISFEEQTYS